MSATIKKDFGDWLSPMLVKEMRQGLRSKVFVSAFLLIQGLMIFSVIISLAFQEGDYNNGSTVIFWLMIGTPLLLVMPSYGFGVLGGEIKGNTLELLFLTRLSSWRIVAGKWTAIVAQTLLIVCSVLPYTVLRYFLGGVNLLDDLQALGLMLFGSAVLTSVAIAISPFHRSMLAKMFLPFVPIVAGIVVINILENQGISSMSPFDIILTSLGLGPLFLLLMFEIAVARIAPPAENHSLRKRLLGLLILGVAALLNRVVNSPVLPAITLLLLIPQCITALCEEIKPIPSIYAPFVRRGFFGRAAGLVFYPGWASGLVFTAIIFIGFYAAFAPSHPVGADWSFSLIATAGGLLMPMAVTRLFFSRLNRTFAIYIGLQIFMFVVAVVLGTLRNTPLASWTKLAAPLPTSALFLDIFRNMEDSEKPYFTAVGTIVLLLSLLALLLMWVKERRKLSALEQQAREMLMEPAASRSTHENAA